MKIGDEEITVVLTGVLKVNEIFKRAQIIAEVESAAGLNTRYKNRLFHIDYYTSIITGRTMGRRLVLLYKNWPI